MFCRLPPALDGHILEEKKHLGRRSHPGRKEKASRQRLVADWQKEQEKKWQGLVKKAHERLTKAGIPKDAVVNNFKPKDYDVAEDILNEAEAGGFDTVVMGRRGLGMAKTLLLGSVTHKVVQNAKGCAVIVVE